MGGVGSHDVRGVLLNYQVSLSANVCWKRQRVQNITNVENNLLVFAEDGELASRVGLGLARGAGATDQR